MVLMENDVIFVYMNEGDKNHEVARGIFEKIRAGELSVYLSSVGLIEMELIYGSQEREGRLLRSQPRRARGETPLAGGCRRGARRWRGWRPGVPGESS
ncbi:MAG: hypothetical protein QI223_05700 [Candidatus Korarchaeota archaeon]|nr:hypothetical protein [Candidatus Korarchaeota archaeon]